MENTPPEPPLRGLRKPSRLELRLIGAGFLILPATLYLTSALGRLIDGSITSAMFPLGIGLISAVCAYVLWRGLSPKEAAREVLERGQRRSVTRKLQRALLEGVATLSSLSLAILFLVLIALVLQDNPIDRQFVNVVRWTLGAAVALWLCRSYLERRINESDVILFKAQKIAAQARQAMESAIGTMATATSEIHRLEKLVSAKSASLEGRLQTIDALAAQLKTDPDAVRAWSEANEVSQKRSTRQWWIAILLSLATGYVINLTTPGLADWIRAYTGLG